MSQILQQSLKTIPALVSILNQGGIAIVPTDTIYGLLGKATMPKVVERIYRVRRRNREKPMIVLISSLKDLALFGVTLGDAQIKMFLKRVWFSKGVRSFTPSEGGDQGSSLLNHNKSLALQGGDRTAFTEPVSVVFQSRSRNSAYLHRGGNTIAFRVPRSTYLLSILKKTGPLVAPSGNLEGLPPAQTVCQAWQYFGEAVDCYVDGGTVRGKPSLVVEYCDGAFTFVRGSKKDLKRLGTKISVL